MGIVVMAPLTLASVSGLLLQMKVSTGTQDAQRLEVSLTEAGEDLMAVPYVSCGDPVQYQELLDGWSAALDPKLVSTSQAPAAKVVAVEYWNSAKGVFLPECVGDDGAQRVTMVTVAADRSARGTVVKRNPATRAAGTG